jgi:hypothetical protein
MRVEKARRRDLAQPRHSGGVAQWIEQEPSKLKVAGSIPAAPVRCSQVDGSGRDRGENLGGLGETLCRGPIQCKPRASHQSLSPPYNAAGSIRARQVDRALVCHTGRLNWDVGDFSARVAHRWIQGSSEQHAHPVPILRHPPQAVARVHGDSIDRATDSQASRSAQRHRGCSLDSEEPRSRRRDSLTNHRPINVSPQRRTRDVEAPDSRRRCADRLPKPDVELRLADPLCLRRLRARLAGRTAEAAGDQEREDDDAE